MIVEVKRINLSGLTNTRDLGGFPAANGRKIRHHRLIRSGELKKASSADLVLLRDAFGVHTVVDLRMDAEREQSPNPEIPGVTTIALPLLDSSFFGIARDEHSVEAWMRLFEDPSVDPVAVFQEMYRKLMFSDYVKPHFRTFFDTLLANEEGAVLWHCSAGKDRAGVAAMLVLMALGVDREDIILDYMMTGEFTKKELRSFRLMIPLFVRKKRTRQCLRVLLGVDESYVRQLFDLIDGQYGGERGYLKRFVGLTDPEIEKLRTMYLI